MNNINDIAITHICPHCGISHYLEIRRETTCLMWFPIYKDGILINTDPNTTTVYCKCLNCGENFKFEE